MVYPFYLRVSGRVQVDVSSMNRLGTVGNIIELMKATVIEWSKGTPIMREVPVVTGNMIKHWHFIHFIDAYRSLGGTKLCNDCKRGIGFRSRIRRGNDEALWINECAADDVHGFLNPDAQVRRESLVKCSFMVPVEGVEPVIDTLIHNRVVVDEKGKIEGEGMMPFKPQHTSTLYGFNMSLNVKYVGKRLAAPPEEESKNPAVKDASERSRRSSAAIAALIPLLSGYLGANISRSEPIWVVRELLIAWSEAPLPQLVHGRFNNYAEESVKVITAWLQAVNAKAVIASYPKDLGNRLKQLASDLKATDKLEIRATDNWAKLLSELSNVVGNVKSGL